MGLSEFLKKTLKDSKSNASQAGQAVLEYILVLVVTVSIILGTLYQFSDAFKEFLDGYFGDYIACLLETGELPSLGGQGPNQSECVMPNFSLDAGDALQSSSDGSSDSGSRGGRSSSNRNSSTTGSEDSSSDSSGRNTRSARPSRFTGSGGASNGESVGGSSASMRPSSIRKRADAQGNSSSGFEAGASEGSVGGRRGNRRSRKRVVYLGESYLDNDAKKKKESAVIGKASKSKKSSEVKNLRNPKFKLDLPEERVVASEADLSGFSFGALIKMMLILGIIIAIFIFLGGQALQIKKSWQKSE